MILQAATAVSVIFFPHTNLQQKTPGSFSTYDFFQKKQPFMQVNSLEVKPTKIISPQFWMMKIPYLKQGGLLQKAIIYWLNGWRVGFRQDNHSHRSMTNQYSKLAINLMVGWTEKPTIILEVWDLLQQFQGTISWLVILILSAIQILKWIGIHRDFSTNCFSLNQIPVPKDHLTLQWKDEWTCIAGVFWSSKWRQFWGVRILRAHPNLHVLEILGTSQQYSYPT